VKTNKSNLSKVLIFLGVSVWVVYFTLLFIGRHPSLYIFLPIHLTFIFTGVKLRKSAGEGQKKEKSEKLKNTSEILLAIGMAAWFPYFYIHYYYEIDVNHLPFMILHLSAMLSGGVLKMI
jgi:hypothetical protein